MVRPGESDRLATSNSTRSFSPDRVRVAAVKAMLGSLEPNAHHCDLAAVERHRRGMVAQHENSRRRAAHLHRQGIAAARSAQALSTGPLRPGSRRARVRLSQRLAQQMRLLAGEDESDGVVVAPQFLARTAAAARLRGAIPTVAARRASMEYESSSTTTNGRDDLPLQHAGPAAAATSMAIANSSRKKLSGACIRWRIRPPCRGPRWSVHRIKLETTTRRERLRSQ